MVFDNLKVGVVTIVLIALMAGALSLGLDGIQDGFSSEQACWNSSHYYNVTGDRCLHNSTDTTAAYTAFSEAYNITEGGLKGAQNSTDYLDTIGVLLGVSALIGIVVAGFYQVMK